MASSQVPTGLTSIPAGRSARGKSVPPLGRGSNWWVSVFPSFSAFHTSNQLLKWLLNGTKLLLNFTVSVHPRGRLFYKLAESCPFLANRDHSISQSRDFKFIVIGNTLHSEGRRNAFLLSDFTMSLLKLIKLVQSFGKYGRGHLHKFQYIEKAKIWVMNSPLHTPFPVLVFFEKEKRYKTPENLDFSFKSGFKFWHK